jgi:ribosomal protein S18 acetylase RimI-like enzyme
MGPGSVVLRAPRKTDAARVREIVDAARIFRADEVEVALEVFVDAVTAPGKDYFAVGAYDDGRLIGFACYGPTPCTLSTWDLYWIAVDPDVQRLGVGRRMMEACEKVIRGRNGQLIVIETASRPDYAATRAFYETLGYERAARISDYYAPGDDLVVFAKHFGSSMAEGGHHG